MSAAEDDDRRLILSMVPHGKKIAAFVRDQLPPGTDWGVFIVAPGHTAAEKRTVAFTSDRERVVRPVAAWVMETLENMKGTTS